MKKLSYDELLKRFEKLEAEKTNYKKTKKLQSVLYNILNASISARTLLDLLKNIHKHLIDIIDAKNFYVALVLDRKKGLFTFPYFADEKDTSIIPTGRTLNLSGGITDYMIKKGGPLLLDIHKINKLVDEGKIDRIGSPASCWMGAPIRDNRGNIFGTVVVQDYNNPKAFSDIDLKFFTIIANHISIIISQKSSEEKLRESQERYRNLIENISEWIWETDSEWTYTYVSPRVKDMLGYKPDELLNTKAFDYIDVSDNSNVRKKFEKISKKQKPIRKLETVKIHKNGEKVIIESNGIPFFDEVGNLLGYRGVDHDITELKQTEEERKNLKEQLIQSQKLESIGRLAGGIAHEFNNTLTGIMGYAEILKMRYEGIDEGGTQAAETIINGAERAAHLTQQLLGFARGGKYNPVPLDINSLIKDTINVTEKSFNKNLYIKYNFEKNINYFNGDRNQIQQVLTNLILNAKDSMLDGGGLFFKTKNRNLGKKFKSKFADFEEGNYVVFSITDTGTGIPEDVREKIFEPFFTTKDVGQGTGLGLATVYGIIKNHDGYIDVDSKLDKGTTFTIYLPMAEEVKITFADEPEIIDTGKKGQSVLVVDDEQTVQRLAKLELESFGYNVIIANDGDKAVDIYEKKSKNIDLVLLDVIMPNMDGKIAFRELKKINPDVQVIVMSGYSMDGKALEIMNEGAQGFIQKPFRMHELSQILSDILK
ncbi:response regulator [candidate division KSB1 bacterium]